MPDFEKLIRHQQLKQPKTNQRLKVVDKRDFKKENNETTKFNDFDALGNVFGGFVGSVIGTLTILFLYVNEYLPMDLLKLK